MNNHAGMTLGWIVDIVGGLVAGAAVAWIIWGYGGMIYGLFGIGLMRGWRHDRERRRERQG